MRSNFQYMTGLGELCREQLKDAVKEAGGNPVLYKFQLHQTISLLMGSRAKNNVCITDQPLQGRLKAKEERMTTHDYFSHLCVLLGSPAQPDVPCPMLASGWVP